MILYKKTLRDVRIWDINIVDSTLSIQHGMLGGNLQTDEVVLGSHSDAQEEMTTRINHKILREGYSESMDCPPPGLPMLLQNFRDHKEKLPDKVYVQPKYDGVRCIGTRLTMFTRKKETITSMPHIQQALSTLPQGVTLDGELYNHNMYQQVIGGLCRLHQSTDECKKVKYVVFDIQMEGPYRVRLEHLNQLKDTLNPEHIKIAPTKIIDKHKAEEEMMLAVADGYEGVILRAAEGKYLKDYRTYDAQKLKPLYKQEFALVDIVCAEKGREKGLAIAVCLAPNGKPFQARLTGSSSYRSSVYAHKTHLLPGTAEIEFSDWSEKEIPQHPRCIQIYGKKSLPST